MFWIIFGAIIFLIAAAVLVYIFIRDRRYEKGSVVETMSADLWDEIATERETALSRARRFKEALKAAKDKA